MSRRLLNKIECAEATYIDKAIDHRYVKDSPLPGLTMQFHNKHYVLKDGYKEVEIKITLKDMPFKGYTSVYSKPEILSKSSWKNRRKTRCPNDIEPKGKEVVEEIHCMRTFCEGGTSRSGRSTRHVSEWEMGQNTQIFWSKAIDKCDEIYRVEPEKSQK